MVTDPRYPGFASLVLRLGLGITVLYHGLLKLLVNSGSWDPALPPLLQQVVAWVEIISGAALLIGVLARPAALANAVIQVMAIVLVTGQRRFSSIGDTRGTQQLPGFDFKVGWEYNFALIVMCIAVMLLGAGPLGLGHYLWRRNKAAETQKTPEPVART